LRGPGASAAAGPSNAGESCTGWCGTCLRLLHRVSAWSCDVKILKVNDYARLRGGADATAWILLTRRGRADMTSCSCRLLIRAMWRLTRGSAVLGYSCEQGGASSARAVYDRAHGVLEPRVCNSDERVSLHPGVVHAHKLHPELSVAPIVLAARSGMPILQTIHDYEVVSASPLDKHTVKARQDKPDGCDERIELASLAGSLSRAWASRRSIACNCRLRGAYV
jgi:hypothetical protein